MSSISDRRLAANRANAKKSTGPRTPQGKARSRMNGLKHGLFASKLALPDDTPDVAAELAAIRRGLLAQVGHAGPVERLLVETVIAAYYRLAKAYGSEARVFKNTASTSPPKQPPASPDASPQSTTLDFNLLLRHEARLERMLDRCLDRLFAHRHRFPSLAEDPRTHSAKTCFFQTNPPSPSGPRPIGPAPNAASPNTSDNQ
jgi:hypothetical protein